MEEGGCRGKTPARVPQDAKPFCISSAGGERKPSGGRFSLGEPSPGVPRCSAVRCIRLYKKAGTHRRKGVCLLFRLCRRGVGSALLSRLPGLAAPEESLYASEPAARRCRRPADSCAPGILPGSARRRFCHASHRLLIWEKFPPLPGGIRILRMLLPLVRAGHFPRQAGSALLRF